MSATDVLAEFQELLASGTTEPGAGATDLLLQGMEPAAAELLRRCAIPHQFGMQILGVLAPDLDELAVGKQYEEFARLAIITPSPEFLMMHDQSRRPLFRRWLESERRDEFAAISRRLFDYFEERADLAVLPSGKDVLQRRRMFHLIGFDQDRGVAEFERLSREKRRQWRLTEFENLIMRVHEYDEVLTPENRIRVDYHEAKLAADRRDWDRAKALLETIAENPSALRGYRVKALHRLGMIHVELRQFRTAIAYYERARDLATKRQNPEVFRIILDLGAARRDNGDLPEAERLLKEGIDLAKKARSFFSIAVGSNSLGMLYRRLNDIPRAIKNYKQSLENLDKAGEIFRRGQVLCELGAASAELREWDVSEKYLLESLQIEQQAGDKHNQAITQNNLARVYQASHRPKEALESARAAMRLFQETRDYYRGAMATRNFAKLCRVAKDRSACEQAFRDAIEQFRRCNEIDAVRETERELASLTRKIGLPWWAWLLVALVILLVVYFALSLSSII
jgi:tetratricopeptide (TPR) repeat protein